VTPLVPSRPHLGPIIARDVHKRPTDSFGRPSASPLAPPRLVRPSVGRREIPGWPLVEFHTDVASALNLMGTVVPIFGWLLLVRLLVGRKLWP
jgi:hypothetical protein